MVLPLCVVMLAANRVDVLLLDGAVDGAPDGASLGEEFTAAPLTFIACTVFTVPLISSSAARLHDTGRSAWWLLIVTIPVVGGMVLLYLCGLSGQPGANQYGPARGQGAVSMHPQGGAAPSGGYPQQLGL